MVAQTRYEKSVRMKRRLANKIRSRKERYYQIATRLASEFPHLRNEIRFMMFALGHIDSVTLHEYAKTNLSAFVFRHKVITHIDSAKKGGS